MQLADAPLGVTVARAARTAGTSFTLDDTPDSVTNATAGTTYTGAAYVKSAATASLGATVGCTCASATPPAPCCAPSTARRSR